jgi:hypothetical protein
MKIILILLVSITGCTKFYEVSNNCDSLCSTHLGVHEFHYTGGPPDEGYQCICKDNTQQTHNYPK